MKNCRFLIYLLTITLFSCSTEDIKEKSKSEILQTERAFAMKAATDGAAEAFAFYAADDAAISRKGKIIKGKNDLIEYYKKNEILGNSKLEWTPEFVEVSESGDLGYTYGYYTFIVSDSTRNEIKSTGVFHTVWKKQDDGSWKFVWD